ncbi:MAG: bifunctional diaminohydroxyphosphoribosylaminopyrimidine deaminase/5-amino-6-(5-phosphoribosylamino)uracil reductase RibD [Candidatus Lightella neohaematopini]|nr:bifunctional diaminohydroxyphosphoribosylaminopyrimidine deaminase/5-amino-6-(5-phosphoribosylamino)uracil reductase RibD [Candidatus Lightella neohaematopini]MCV2528912.1 bifunctional diaminohydroxyphosphoribosylaminopyrimidine deaminase/5-amino-6-(5-phosphoribosylamino)uracil reductase RibD [Candidatus Lightella neohaematopini]
MNNQDKIYLLRAFKLAKLGKFSTFSNPNVGCVIVKNNNIVGEGYHEYYGGHHAEINALNMAGKNAYGSTVYVTLEPCNFYNKTPPCTEALIKNKVFKVIAATLDPNPKVSGMGFNKLKSYGILVEYGYMLDEAEKLNYDFFKRIRTGIPWISLKLASSLDGRTNYAFNKKKWITSIKSRQDVQIFRAKSDVILSTSSTIISDNPKLTVRKSLLPKYIKNIYSTKYIRNPIRVIIDVNNRINKDFNIIQDNRETWLIRSVINNDLLKLPKVKQIILPTYIKNNKVYLNLIELLLYLGKNEINKILVEAGSILSSILIKKRLIDEFILYQSPKIIGANANALFNINQKFNSFKIIKFKILDVKKIGVDIRIRLVPNN